MLRAGITEALPRFGRYAPPVLLFTFLRIIAVDKRRRQR